MSDNFEEFWEQKGDEILSIASCGDEELIDREFWCNAVKMSHSIAYYKGFSDNNTFTLVEKPFTDSVDVTYWEKGDPPIEEDLID